MKANLEVVALSRWIGDAPFGSAHDEVFERLHARFPSQTCERAADGSRMTCY